MVKWMGFIASALLSAAALAAPQPYDEHADAHAHAAAGPCGARASGKDVLVVFGANWCQDCRELDKALHGRTASLIDARFVVVKIDVGNFDKNLDVAKRYGYPIGKGIPAAVVLNADDKVLDATRAELFDKNIEIMLRILRENVSAPTARFASRRRRLCPSTSPSSGIRMVCGPMEESG